MGTSDPSPSESPETQRRAVASRNRRERIVLASAAQLRRSAARSPYRYFTGYCLCPCSPSAGNGSGLLCGRIAWLEKARDTGGHPTRDNNNPEPAFRRRPLFGKTKTLLWVPRLGSEGSS